VAESPWWHGAVLYQLYARSWRDSNSDGYGDLAGIIERLDHLSWLGVDGIWLSPTMPSPDADWGYDVSDYTAVHPDLGTLADLDALIAAAADRDIRVLLDLVPNHTSSAHPWFVDAVSGPGGEHRGYYVWADPAPGGGPPNNWLDATGQPGWQWDPASGQYYLHNFLPAQPDLNWWDEAVHREFRDILAFWFDRGVAGFRIDVAHGLYKDAGLRDNPPLPPGGGQLDGRFGQRQVFSANRPQTHAVYRDWRAIAESYAPARLLLGETWIGDLDRLAAYYGQDDELQLAFNFPFAFAGLAAAELADIVTRTLAALPDGACPVWMGSNHDIGRFPTRWCGGDPARIRLALLILLTLPGAVVLYYGDEIGMTEADVPFALRRDAMTRSVPAAEGGNRDRARTPLRWDDSPGGGFSAAGVVPWLPVAAGPAPSVAGERADSRSVLWLCKELIALRHRDIGAEVTDVEVLPARDGLLAWRVGSLLMAANLSDLPGQLPAAAGEIVLSAAGRPVTGKVLGPWDGVVTRLTGGGAAPFPA
jgi:alpha-glucosidase